MLRSSPASADKAGPIKFNAPWTAAVADGSKSDSPDTLAMKSSTADSHALLFSVSSRVSCATVAKMNFSTRSVFLRLSRDSGSPPASPVEFAAWSPTRSVIFCFKVGTFIWEAFTRAVCLTMFHCCSDLGTNCFARKSIAAMFTARVHNRHHALRSSMPPSRPLHTERQPIKACCPFMIKAPASFNISFSEDDTASATCVSSNKQMRYLLRSNRNASRCSTVGHTFVNFSKSMFTEAKSDIFARPPLGKEMASYTKNASLHKGFGKCFQMASAMWSMIRSTARGIPASTPVGNCPKSSSKGHKAPHNVVMAPLSAGCIRFSTCIAVTFVSFSRTKATAFSIKRVSSTIMSTTRCKRP
mmetsp:Transcript_26683/g.53364  ORF Transcript_26683/g.53364 Transcript_26683/m.53364 type:complete len:357 (+) Transcript_26683:880-1950(+)